MKKQISLLLCILNACAALYSGTDISKIDKNFESEKIGGNPVRFENALGKPFEITGFPWRKDGEGFCRIPPNLTETDVNNGVLGLAKNTAGGAIRFMTDSPYIAIRARLSGADMNHMPRAASAGFDLYVKDANSENDKYIKTFQPSPQEVRNQKDFEAIAHLGGRQMRLCTIYMPLYGGVNSMKIGVSPDCKIEIAPPQKIAKPVLFYGSSITQGGCASRAANNYTTMLCRAIDAPQINMGFSGSAKGEAALAKAIASLELSAFVFDYDYNAPNAEHLKKTHEKFFKIIREARPELPVIILSRCSHREDARRDAVKQTFLNAKNAGDKLVWFIDGAELFEGLDDYATCDGCHPNDLGFYLMYKHILPVLRQAVGANR